MVVLLLLINKSKGLAIGMVNVYLSQGNLEKQSIVHAGMQGIHECCMYGGRLT